MNSNRPPQFIRLVISLECVLLAAFLILLSPVGDVISDSVAASGHAAENSGGEGESAGNTGETESGEKKDFIKWVDFQVTKEAMQQAFRYDVDTCQSEIHLNWIELLAYLGARYGGDFSRYKAADMKAIADRILGGEKMEDITADMKYYSYYLEAYGAVLGGMVGEFKVEIPASEAPEFALGESSGSGQDGGNTPQGSSAAEGGSEGSTSRKESPGEDVSQENGVQEEDVSGRGDGGSQRQEGTEGSRAAQEGQRQEGETQEKKTQEGQTETNDRNDGKVWVTKYGLKAFSPIAKNYPYNDYDDFGVARSYGFKRQHLGHDMMGQVGTPVIAVESGYVEAIGWNQYGGWRLGIRSFDGKRYYYYAHLRKNYPYHKSLQEGSVVQAGDVIGYLGRTGYSRTENTNNIDEPHLHFGIQLIFDESQKDGNNEIWIDCYEIVKFLAMNRAETVKKQETKEYYRVYQMVDPVIPGGPVEQRMPEDGEGQDAGEANFQ